MSEQRNIGSVAELVKALGGPASAGRLFEVSPQVIVHWRNKNRIPARYYPVHITALGARQLHAPITLWDFVQREAS